MEVFVTLYSSLRPSGTSPLSVHMDPGCTAGDLLRELEIADHEVEVVVVNGNLRQFDTVLGHQDQVVFIPFVSGG